MGDERGLARRVSATLGTRNGHDAPKGNDPVPTARLQVKTTNMTDIETQYKAVREGIGLIDRSDVGKIAISGEDCYTWLQGMVSNDVRLLENGATGRLQTCVLDATAHVLSDITLINVPEDHTILLDLPRANVTKILSLFDRLIITEEVELADVTETLGCFSLQGPGSMAWLVMMESDRMFNAAWDNLEALMDADHTGSGGVDLYFARAAAAQLKQTNALKSVNDIGAEAQEILRVEAGIPKYGVDMDETTLAPEAGLMATHISLSKGCYVGQEIVARIHSRGHTNRALTGLVFADGDIPTPGDKIMAEEDGKTRETGRITSVVAASPALNGRPIALGYVRHEHRAPGSQVEVVGRDRTRFANVVELPFYFRGK